MRAPILFSLGAVLYEMISGRPAFPGLNTAEIFASLLHAEPPGASEFALEAADEVDGVVSRALSKDVSKRYQTMSDFAADLARIQRGCQTGRARKPGWLSIRRLKARDKGNPSLPFRTQHKTRTKLRRPVYLTALTTALAAATFGVYSLPLRAWRDAGPPQRIVPSAVSPV